MKISDIKTLILEKLRNIDSIEIYDKWKLFGLLEGLDENDAKKCALLFEYGYDYLIEKNDGILNTIGLPLLRRLLKSLRASKFFVKAFIDELEYYTHSSICDKDVAVRLYEYMEANNGNRDGFDIEAEIMMCFEKYYTSSL